MSKIKDAQIKWFLILFSLIFVGSAVFAVFYLYKVFQKEGIDRFMYATVLVVAILIGLAHIFLFFARKWATSDHSNLMKSKKRQLQKIRNAITYLTPIVLLAMLYHFWKSSNVLVSVVVTLLLLDRLNELRKSYK